MDFWKNINSVKICVKNLYFYMFVPIVYIKEIGYIQSVNFIPIPIINTVIRYRKHINPLKLQEKDFYKDNS